MTATIRFPRHEGDAVLDGPLLLDAAARAEEETVMLAIEFGADLNMSDASGRTLVSCIIGGESWADADVSNASYTLQTRLSMLKNLLHHNDVSLYTLNVPVSGVTPLGLAAWLNSPDVVRLLLEESHGMVLADCIDTYGATPLMYAARDGRYEVVSTLLEHGARPDRRDAHHRSSIQYALSHPRVLEICESTLRRYRAAETARSRNLAPLPEPFRSRLLACCSPEPSCSAQSSAEDQEHSAEELLQAVRCNNLPLLYSLLLPSPADSAIDLTLQCTPPLINAPYSDGWSLLHHCVTADRQCVAMLDALYRMGADMGLYTLSGHGTALHCIAHTATATHGNSEGVNLRSFVYHLVRDLGAPLAAMDANEDTCLHVVAERGESLDVLMAFLACDVDGRVRAMRNARGLTAWDMAKPEFRAVFDLDAEHLRTLSCAAVRILSPTKDASLRPMPSLSSLASSLLFSQPSPGSGVDDGDFELRFSTAPQRIVSNLQHTSRELASPTTLDVGACRRLLAETSELGEDLIERMRAHVHDAEAELEDACHAYKQVGAFLVDTARGVDARLAALLPEDSSWDDCDCARKRDSQATAVSQEVLLPRKSRSMSDLRPRSGTVGSDRTAVSLPESLGQSSSSMTRPSTEVPSPEVRHGLEEPRPPTPPPKDPGRQRSKSDLRSLAPLQGLDKLLPSDADKKSALSPRGTSKIKEWFRKKISGGADSAPQSLDADRQATTAPPSVTVSRVPSLRRKRSLSGCRREHDPVLEAKWRAAFGCRRCLSVAERDMLRVEKCMDAAEQFIAKVHKYLAQAERTLDSAILSRKASLECARIKQLRDSLEDGTPRFGPVEFPSMDSKPATSSSKSSLHNFTPCTTASSSVVSLSMTLVDAEDHDVRVLRRLLGRKIEAQTEGAFQEIDRIMVWLRIVRDALRGVKRRTLTLA